MSATLGAKVGMEEWVVLLIVGLGNCFSWRNATDDLRETTAIEEHLDLLGKLKPVGSIQNWYSGKNSANSSGDRHVGKIGEEIEIGDGRDGTDDKTDDG